MKMECCLPAVLYERPEKICCFIPCKFELFLPSYSYTLQNIKWFEKLN